MFVGGGITISFYNVAHAGLGVPENLAILSQGTVSAAVGDILARENFLTV